MNKEDLIKVWVEDENVILRLGNNELELTAEEAVVLYSGLHVMLKKIQGKINMDLILNKSK